jgi:hypothetical protein
VTAAIGLNGKREFCRLAFAEAAVGALSSLTRQLTSSVV